ncbi:50S ribosomal protein L18 [Candidatus Woesebacteria bacterium RIFOXYC1_FULL_31_51]|uniref:Large ribosomal subunit protein uL18 n=1 Tax=Candidatus Woesebacteria bacterium GW2011_GWC2_31_9 TaxID=1618586 RepID=A0A0G0BM62_9BACT|nr:MAG: 50S ribosomal protein L18, large subunit ribosomal protein L18 [Candidatus Woesebacteria bacterium GW2011_GWF1_31_35]KKP23329.1 MAG: 50S ribosomal protein L18 [Candidatus Woesebacteria bacterium GW2011_GWC1_30_29]KKP26153.1 MAG: 50S ribosomal protein L18 [Candidatus Woesebacteria bacterium GW2011_GWD1_31_12]KKP27590.1 MAG: 50S ribosomal protein L18 [Candidatus Woesebacteria bacterium GW2011_GWB1_31_29]KKP31034.1 MAG: 50S ribosomal protein L18 [Candidatus Woesebacteria bacterium GW2011_G
MKTKFDRRKFRVRSKINGTGIRPRLSVFRSNKFVSAQIIDDEKGLTIVSMSDKSLGKLGKLEKDGIGRAKELGKLLAEKAKTKKIKKTVFDKGGYKYHGKIKAVADGAREGGLEF